MVHLAGASHVFANDVLEHCENCRRNDDLIHESVVHLGRRLVHVLPEAASFDPKEVEPYLTRNLKLRIVDVSLYPLGLLYFLIDGLLELDCAATGAN